MSNQEVINTISKARQNSSQLFYTAIDLGGLDTEKLNKTVLGTGNRAGFFEGRQIDILGETNGATKDQIYKALGLSDKDLEKQLSSASINAISPIAGKAPGSYQVTVYDSDGNPKTLLVAGSDQQKAAFTPSYKAFEYEREGKTGVNQFSANGQNYVSNTKLIIDPQTQEPKFTTIIAKYSQVGTKDQTNDLLKRTGKSKVQLEQEGYMFNKDGNVVKPDKMDNL
jgi:hypothetical protein